jgi:hypothetical protein
MKTASVLLLVAAHLLLWRAFGPYAALAAFCFTIVRVLWQPTGFRLGP